MLRSSICIHLNNFKVVDCSWHKPETKRSGKQEFHKQHIPGAHYFDIDDCANKSTELEHMLPVPKDFENYVGELGINNQTHVIVYDNNQDYGMFSAARGWWMFQIFGHENVSILDGGLPKWKEMGFDVTDKIETVVPAEFIAQFVPSLVKSFEEIRQNLSNKQFMVVDARSAGKFDGTT